MHRGRYHSDLTSLSSFDLMMHLIDDTIFQQQLHYTLDTLMPHGKGMKAAIVALDSAGQFVDYKFDPSDLSSWNNELPDGILLCSQRAGADQFRLHVVFDAVPAPCFVDFVCHVAACLVDYQKPWHMKHLDRLPSLHAEWQDWKDQLDQHLMRALRARLTALSDYVTDHLSAQQTLPSYEVLDSVEACKRELRSIVDLDPENEGDLCVDTLLTLWDLLEEIEADCERELLLVEQDLSLQRLAECEGIRTTLATTTCVVEECFHAQVYDAESYDRAALVPQMTRVEKTQSDLEEAMALLLSRGSELFFDDDEVTTWVIHAHVLLTDIRDELKPLWDGADWSIQRHAKADPEPNSPPYVGHFPPSPVSSRTSRTSCSSGSSSISTCSYRDAVLKGLVQVY